MKNRKIPYGYEMKNGAVVINGAEAETVKNIFSEYVNGLVLKDIAATLKAQGAEYLPGETDWNKSRVKRIIDDARYCGNGKCSGHRLPQHRYCFRPMTIALQAHTARGLYPGIHPP